MGIRIQPKEVEVPEGAPFANDLLNRKGPAEVLTSLIQGIEGPCVLSVDAAWGVGKTTFLRMWAQHLLDEGFPVVAFNAWETDFTDIPFVALSAELTDSIEEKYGEALPKDAEQKIARFSEVSKKILKQVVPGTIQMLTKGVINVEEAMASYVQQRLTEYSEQRDAIKEFREALTSMAETLSELEQHKGRPLVVMIDELDRCRPTYAVEFLETAKHLFAVDNIIFVLTVNRKQMEHAVQALYGNKFDAQKYLYRFFDLDFTLPAPDRTVFIRASLNAINIDDYFKRTYDKRSKRDREVMENLLRAFFQADGVSLRDIQQAIHRIGLVLYSLPDKYFTFTVGTVAALILRTINPDLYYRFTHKGVPDEEVIDSVFNSPGLKSLKQKHEGRMFEAAIILGAQEMQDIPWRKFGPENSPLWGRYLVLAEDHRKNNQTSPEKEHAFEVTQILDGWYKIYPETRRVAFKHAVERIELFSPDLIDQQSADQN